MDTFPRKQVHLDFHTSPDIHGIGSRFSKEQFQAALKAGHLDSITIFAKCHHGLCYYPTEVGTMHPGLDFDLTGAMLEAAHEIGVRAPIYITAGWSELDAEQHPEWIAVDQNGEKILSEGMQKSLRRGMHRQREEVAWSNLCLNDGDYCAHIYAITEEVCKRYPVVDGLFFDICVMENRCYCETCLQGMAELGLDPKKEEDARAYYILKRKAFMEKCGEILKKYHPDATIFFNSGGADQYRPAYHAHQSHFEMEDLPTVWGGYDKLPVRAKYFSKSGKPYLGMTGKFHLIWGEFGGFKSKEALKYEVCSMALYGAGCSIGDHVHPDGEMELQTYRNMGAIAMCSLIKGENQEERFCRLLELTRQLAGNPDIRVDEAVYLSEKSTGHKNRALAYLLKSHGLLEGETEDVLDCYFRACSISVNCQDLARIGSALANRGKSLQLEQRLFPSRYATYVNAVMMTCGMYDGSGNFAVNVGVPAKSGVGGGIMAVVPTSMSIGIFSPALDSKGNSMAGIEVLRRLSRALYLSIF